ncbi:MAG: Dabb family protein [Bacteroidales bacterium]|nr:Dabb family protein [Bacteroidales bacterium]
MIHHIVMFKLLETPDREQKDKNKMELKKRLEALPGKIDVIRSMKVGINVKESARAFDVVLVSTFDNLEDLEIYRVHPAHQEVVEYINGIREKTASVDYES